MERDEAYLCSETERLWSSSINNCGPDECLTHYSLWTICETAKFADWLLILKLFVLMREFLNFAFQNLGQSIINI